MSGSIIRRLFVSNSNYLYLVRLCICHGQCICPTKEIKVAKGLRQGGPLAHFLFFIVTEGLSGLRRRAIARRMFGDFKFGEEVHVSLL